MVHIPHSGTNDPPPALDGQSLPTVVTPTENATSCNNLPEQVPHVPNNPDSDRSSLNYSSSESYDSSDSRHFKRARRTHKKHRLKRQKTNPIQ